jgi:hypothetical protein
MNARSIVAGINGSPLIVTLIAALVVTVAVATPPAHAGDHAWTDGHKKPAGELVKVVREATRRFRDVRVAEAEGYQLHFGCVSSPDRGAMGLHYVNMTLVGDGVLQPDRPEIIIYEPLPNGRLRLIGADYLTLSGAWHANNAATPQLMGQLLHLIQSPNRYGLPDFYTLHVWAWKKNPFGTYTNWHPGVSCEAFDGEAH